MATDRLRVLAGAAALREFTTPELAAYTGVSTNTVRQVLQREQKRRTCFDRVSAGSASVAGRPALLWALREDCRAAILDEVSSEETDAAQLVASASMVADRRPTGREISERTAMYVASAEDAVAQSYAEQDPDARRTYAQIALNLLNAADPSTSDSVDTMRMPTVGWWREHRELEGNFIASLDLISSVSIESHLLNSRRSLRSTQQEELLRRRAHRVAAFATLSTRSAQGLAISPDDLAEAAEAISAGSEVLPVSQTLSWIKVFVDMTIASGSPAPVAVLAKSEQIRKQLFPATRGAWSEIRGPEELTRRGYSIWVESWAKTLLTDHLIPGVVVAHDDSTESNDTLSQVMRETEEAGLGRTVVVASTTDSLEVVARISIGGGFFYPIGRSPVELTTFVNRAVIRGVRTTPDLAISYWMASGFSGFDPGSLLATTAIVDLLRTTFEVAARPGDLEIAHKTLAILDDVATRIDADRARLASDHTEHGEIALQAMLARVIEILPPGALSVTEEALRDWLRIAQFKSFRSSQSVSRIIAHRRSVIEQHDESVREIRLSISDSLATGRDSHD